MSAVTLVHSKDTVQRPSEHEEAQSPQADRQPPAVSPYSAADRAAHALVAAMTAGLSPASLAASYFDWSLQSAMSPGARQAMRPK